MDLERNNHWMVHFWTTKNMFIEGHMAQYVTINLLSNSNQLIVDTVELKYSEVLS